MIEEVSNKFMAVKHVSACLERLAVGEGMIYRLYEVISSIAVTGITPEQE